MDKQISDVKTELEKLGFHFPKENIAVGRVPQDSDISGFFIKVEINLDNFPIKQPSIKLISINDKEDLYKSIPVHWRHVDEFVGSNPKNSQFHICCLHNWSAKQEYNGVFIYQRILDWLKSNIDEKWNPEEDLITWRILPQFSQAVIYIPQTFIKELEKSEVRTLFEVDICHQPFTFKTGAQASLKNRGETYSYSQIDYNQSYHFFPEIKGDVEHVLLKDLMIKEKHSKSRLHIIRLPSRSAFKTFYQLLIYIRNNTELTKIEKNVKNIVLFVMFKGDSGKMEYISFIVGREFLDRKKDFQTTILKIESIAQRESAVDLAVGLLGVGSLGSQVARVLVEKDVKKLILADYDRFSLENLGRHVLGSVHLGLSKSVALKNFLSMYYLKNNIIGVGSNQDIEVAEHADLLVVTVGDTQAYDKLAFQKLLNYDKPIIWAWTSENNILQEIVITTKSTGCLNCYYRRIIEDDELKQLQKLAKQEIVKYPKAEIDVCGNPHTASLMERMVFLASQIVSIISYYSKHKSFKFDYVNYYWGMDDIIPTPLVGYLEKNQSCFCN